MRQRVRSPRVTAESSREHLAGGASNGSIARAALRRGRALNTSYLKQLTTALAISLVLLIQPLVGLAQRRVTATITIDTSRPANRIVPAHALGAGVDGHAKGVNDLQLTPANIREMQIGRASWRERG